MSKFTIFILILVVGSLIGNEFIRNTIDTIWTVIWVAFILFLIVFHFLDGKGYFVKKHKKDQEG